MNVGRTRLEPRLSSETISCGDEKPIWLCGRWQSFSSLQLPVIEDGLGISETLSARPVQAAFASAGSFTVGAALPLLLVLIVPRSALVWTVSGGSLLFLALLGATAARTGGAPVGKSVARVTFWGALAMALTAGVGALFGTVV